jgi:hypothetical protein
MRPLAGTVVGLTLLMIGTVCRTTPIEAQAIPRDGYYDYLPPPSRIVSQTHASAELALFAGLAPDRMHRLLEIAERFSPIIRRNNFSVPRDLDAIFGPRHPLNVDLWSGGHLVHTDTIDLAGSASPPIALENRDSAPGAASAADTKLAQLIATRGPRGMQSLISDAEGDADQVLFFDFPGDGPASWRAAYEHLDPNRGSRIFVHPFVHEADSTRDDHRFDLVLQFWFLYPFNDAVNTHEGDWEHINVFVTTRARAAGAATASGARLARADIERVLNAAYPLDSLAIASVGYYFHQQVATLDYLALQGPQRNPDDAHYVWEDLSFVRKAVVERLNFAHGKLATHAIVYAGGNNKGPDELMNLVPRFQRSFKRNSDSSYPLPGTWQTVAGFGVTENVRGSVVPAIDDDPALPWYDMIRDKMYLAYRAADITVLPDWECVERSIATDPSMARRWAWLMLPIYWGFPATMSAGAGLVQHADLGNISPMGPAFQTAWNRVGTAPDYSEYHIRVLRTAVSPATPWAMLLNGWGVLNIPLAAWGLMPGYNVAVLEAMPWIAGSMSIFGAAPARSYSPLLPRRFTTEGQGVYREFGGKEFAGLLLRDDSATTAAVAPGSSLIRDAELGRRLWFNLYFGEHFAVENTYSWSFSDIAVRSSASQIAGRLAMRQLTGGIRYELVPLGSENLQLYSRAGYGWLWYRATNLRANGMPTGTDDVQGGHLPPLLPSPQWWPNTGYAGAGIEAFSPRRNWLAGVLGYGARVEFTASVNRLRFGPSSRHGDVTAHRGELSASLLFGW